MGFASSSEKQIAYRQLVLNFVQGSKGLVLESQTEDSLCIVQSVDNKKLSFKTSDIDEVLSRSDVAGDEFIQVNFSSGQKILLTTSLIGFKPATAHGLDASRIPRVVTTPDVVSVFEAIQDALHTQGTETHEMSILRKVYEAVLSGGESVGFDLSVERSWLARIPATRGTLAS